MTGEKRLPLLGKSFEGVRKTLWIRVFFSCWSTVFYEAEIMRA